ncbi:MAG TPA: hypothetical protein PLV92_11460, partial [Pirellulaceae bacterium]|nr:hypothetical protein [Pirellulaceae bacterium]
MLHPSVVVDRQLDQAISQRRWLRWIEFSATIVAAAACAIGLLAVVVLRGWIDQQFVANSLVGMTALAALVAWLIASVITIVMPPRRGQVAEAIEQSHGALADRLNAVVHMQETRTPRRQFEQRLALGTDAAAVEEQARQQQVEAEYYVRIQKQASQVLTRRAPRLPYSPRQALVRSLIAMVAVAAVFALFVQKQPWSLLRSSYALPPTPPGGPETPEAPSLDIPPPDANVVEEQAPWGEVRISEPGTDLRITKLDTVPLQIEAAASSTLQSVHWVVAKNGGDEQRRELPAPADPRFAVYREQIVPTVEQLVDWDVLSYYAVATTTDGKTYQSDIYFLEILPLREELDELPGGGDGEPFELLDKLTAMIQEQQEVVRQAHRQSRAADPEAKHLKSQRERLAQREEQLSEAARHLGAEAEQQFANSAASELRKKLDDAAGTLKQAESSFQQSSVPDAAKNSREALAKLAAAREFFQESLRQNPREFEPKPDEKAPTPPDTAEQLKEIREMQQQRADEQRRVADLARRQRELMSKVKPGQPQEFPKHATQQDQLNLEFEQLMQERPDIARDFPKETQEARNDTRMASQAMRSMSPQTIPQIGAAAEKLEKLSQAMERREQEERLGEAYGLKKLLDDQIRQLEKFEKQPDSLTPPQQRQAADNSRQLTDQLQKVAQQSPTREQFGDPLREALNDANKQQLDKQCAGLGEGAGTGAAPKAASDLRQGLQKVSEAFQQSQPQTSSP